MSDHHSVDDLAALFDDVVAGDVDERHPDIAVGPEATTGDAEAVASATPSADTHDAGQDDENVDTPKAKKSRRQKAPKAPKAPKSKGNKSKGNKAKGLKAKGNKAARTSGLSATETPAAGQRMVTTKTSFDFTGNRYPKVRRTRLGVLVTIALIGIAGILLGSKGLLSMNTARAINSDIALLQADIDAARDEVSRQTEFGGVTGGLIKADVEARTAALEQASAAHVPVGGIHAAFVRAAVGLGGIESVSVSAADPTGLVEVTATYSGSSIADALALQDALDAMEGVTDAVVDQSGVSPDLTFTVVAFVDAGDIVGNFSALSGASDTTGPVLEGPTVEDVVVEGPALEGPALEGPITAPEMN